MRYLPYVIGFVVGFVVSVVFFDTTVKIGVYYFVGFCLGLIFAHFENNYRGPVLREKK